jgi:hypothetical protein
MDQAQAHHKAALMSALALFDLLEKHLHSAADRATIACEAYDRFMTTLKLSDHYRGADAPEAGPMAGLSFHGAFKAVIPWFRRLAESPDTPPKEKAAWLLTIASCEDWLQQMPDRSGGLHDAYGLIISAASSFHAMEGAPSAHDAYREALAYFRRLAAHPADADLLADYKAVYHDIAGYCERWLQQPPDVPGGVHDAYHDIIAVAVSYVLGPCVTRWRPAQPSTN